MASAPAPPASGAMALMEKYSSLNASIESVGTELASVRSEAEERGSAIALSCVRRGEMTAEAEVAEKERSGWGRKLIAAVERRDGLLAERAVAERAVAEARRSLAAARGDAEEARRSFLEGRRRFRAGCKRVRVAAGEAPKLDPGAANAEETMPPEYRFCSLQALLYQEDFDGETVSKFEDLDGAEEGWIAPTQADIAKARERFKGDSEVMQLLETVARACSRRDGVLATLAELQAGHKADVSRSEKRLRALASQRSQLERVRADMERMEAELAGVEREVREARSIGDCLRNDAERKKRGPGRALSAHSSTSHGIHPQGSYAPSFNLPPEITTAVVEIEHGQYSSSSSSLGVARRITLSPHETAAAAASQPGQRWDSTHLGQQAPTNPYAPATSRDETVGRGGLAPSGPVHNPYASSSGSGHRLNPVQRQHPHRAGRIRTNSRFTTALEIFSGRANDSGDVVGRGSPQSNGLDGYEAEEMETAAARRLSIKESDDRVRRLLQDDDDDEDDDILSLDLFGRK